MNKKESEKIRALRAAFPYTIPVMTGFLFLGLAYGVYARTSGFSFWVPALMSATVFGGSLEFVAVSLLLGSFSPIQTLIMALMIQARHLFYGIAMLEKFRGIGRKKWYLVFGLCDESFSINCSADIPDGVDKGWFMFFVTLLNQLYWVTGAASGGLIGGLLPVKADGLEFVMTAMFTVIFLDQWLKEKQHITAFFGVGISVVCLLLFGADSFLIPAMAGILTVLTVFRKPIERRLET